MTQVGDENTSAYTNRMALIFFTLTFMMFGHSQAVPALVKDREIFYRERGAGLYGAFPYWLSLWIVAAPKVFINVLLYCSILYPMVHFNAAAGCFSFFLGVCFLCSITGLFMCQLVAAVSASAPAAITILPIAYFFCIALSGFLVYLPTLPVWLSVWAPYCSYVRWGFQALVLNEFENNTFLSDATTYIEVLGFQSFSKYQCADRILIFTLSFALLLLFALKFISYEKR
jgi:hypothetical protein